MTEPIEQEYIESLPPDDPIFSEPAKITKRPKCPDCGYVFAVTDLEQRGGTWIGRGHKCPGRGRPRPDGRSTVEPAHRPGPQPGSLLERVLASYAEEDAKKEASRDE